MLDVRTLVGSVYYILILDSLDSHCPCGGGLVVWDVVDSARFWPKLSVLARIILNVHMKEVLIFHISSFSLCHKA